MAFQPIVDMQRREVFAQEALVRGLNGESAGSIFAHVNDANRYRFDQCCRVKGVRLAAELDIRSLLSIDFMPNAVYVPERCIRTTLDAADAYGFPVERIMFESTEAERVDDVPPLRNIVTHYKKGGFTTAIDDFGAGDAGLKLLAEVHSDLIKLDMILIRGIDGGPTRQTSCRFAVTSASG